MPHDAFISYSRKDRAFAVSLQKALAGYRPPKELPVPQRHLDVFRDEDDFTGAEYYESLSIHLGDAAKLIVLCSPAARASAFVDDEIRRFVQAKGPQHIIALLVAGIPNNEAAPGQEALMAFPQALCDALQMPLAQDYRGFDPRKQRIDRGRYEAAWYTTLANLYDISRAEIEQRDRKRRAQRVRLGIGAAVASVAILAGLIVTALFQGQRARENKRLEMARLLESRTRAVDSTAPGQALRVRALLAAASLRQAWTEEGYAAWQGATREMPATLGSIETDSPLIRMAFSRDGRKLVALCGRRHVHLYTLDDLHESRKLQAFETASVLAIDPAAERALAYVATDESLQVADLRDGTLRTVTIPGSFGVAGFAPNGDILAAGPSDLWVVDAAAQTVRSRVHFAAPASRVAFSHDAALALALSGDTLKAYETASGEMRWEARPPGNLGIAAITLGGDGKLVLVAAGTALSLLDLASGAVVRALPGASGTARATPLNDAGYLLGVDVRDPSNGQVLRTLPFDAGSGPMPAIFASPSGRYVAGSVGGPRGAFAVLDVSRPQRRPDDRDTLFYLTLAGGRSAMAAAFSADDGWLAVSSSEADGQHSELHLMSLRRARWRPAVPMRSRHGDFAVLPPDARVVTRRSQPPVIQAYDADGRVMPVDERTAAHASPSGRYTARLAAGRGWIVSDRSGGSEIVIPASGGPLEFSPDERRVLVFPRVYALDDPSRSEAVSNGSPLYKAWSFPGAALVIGKDNETATRDDKASVLFDWSTGKTTPGPGSAYLQYAVAPDARHFATYDLSDGLRLWAVGSSTSIAAAREAKADRDSLIAFSPDGAWLAVGGCNSQAVLYDARTLARRFRVLFDGDCFVGFSADSRYVLSRSLNSGFPEPALHPSRSTVCWPRPAPRFGAL
jgi:WD40 repeat protein